MPRRLWSAASAAARNQSHGGARGREETQSETMKNVEYENVSLGFMAAQTGVQKKHIFKFNFRCLLDSLFFVLSLFLTLSQLAGKRFWFVEKQSQVAWKLRAC